MRVYLSEAAVDVTLWVLSWVQWFWPLIMDERVAIDIAWLLWILSYSSALILYVERGQALEAQPKLPQNSICMPFKCWRGVCGASKHDQPCLSSRVPTHRLGLVASRRFSTIRLSLSTYMPHLNTVSLDTQIHYLCQSNQVNSPPSSCASRERCVL